MTFKEKYGDKSKDVRDGDFDCSEMELTSLEGCYEEINGTFECYGNKLTSLVGAPRIVHGYMEISSNKLTSLVGAPKIVYGDFYCPGNELTTLEGAPKEVQGDFDCTHNPKLKSLDGLLGTEIEGELITDLDTTEFKEHQKVFKLAGKNMTKYKRLMKLRNNS